MAKVIDRIIEVGLVLGLVWLLSGCSTINGFGQDLERMTSDYVQTEK